MLRGETAPMRADYITSSRKDVLCRYTGPGDTQMSFDGLAKEWVGLNMTFPPVQWVISQW